MQRRSEWRSHGGVRPIPPWGKSLFSLADVKGCMVKEVSVDRLVPLGQAAHVMRVAQDLREGKIPTYYAIEKEGVLYSDCPSIVIEALRLLGVQLLGVLVFSEAEARKEVGLIDRLLADPTPEVLRSVRELREQRGKLKSILDTLAAEPPA